MLLTGFMTRLRPEALIYGATHFLKDWSVMDRLDEIKTPTLILAGRQDFQFPPEHQAELAAGIPNSRLVIIDQAGHNVHDEQPGEVLRVIRDFLSTGHTGNV
jgi:proline iminopeptidase